MIRFIPTSLEDQPQICEWLSEDPSKKGDPIMPGWWVTGANCVMAGCAQDEFGPVVYLRFDRDGDLIRMHTVFAPEAEVSKRRVAQAISQAMPALMGLAKKNGGKGIVFESVSSKLIDFMGRFGFVPRPNYFNDFVLMFEEM